MAVGLKCFRERARLERRLLRAAWRDRRLGLSATTITVIVDENHSVLKDEPRLSRMEASSAQRIRIAVVRRAI